MSWMQHDVAAFQHLLLGTWAAFYSVCYYSFFCDNTVLCCLFRDNLFEEMLQEPDEVSIKRKRTRETLRVLQQAFRVFFRF